MENEISELKNYKLSFNGQGKTYFGIVIINWLLTIITLGIYYPWAKAKNLQYIYGATALNNDRFAFHGTGREMFIGFIKAVVIVGILYGIFPLFQFLEMPILGGVIFYFAVIGRSLYFGRQFVRSPNVSTPQWRRSLREFGPL